MLQLFTLQSTITSVATFVAHFAIAMAASIATNVSIDDDSPDPLTGAQFVYGPNNPNVAWNIGQDCTVCLARPDPSQVFDGTWHDGTFKPGSPILSTSISFIGTAVYVMAVYISVAPITHIASLSSVLLTFQINGTTVGIFNRTSSVGIEISYEYNTPVFSQEDLPFGRHELTILNGGGSTPSLILFDRIIYTTNVDSHDTPTSAESSVVISNALQQPPLITTSSAGTVASNIVPTTSTTNPLPSTESCPGIQTVPFSSPTSHLPVSICGLPSDSSLQHRSRKAGVIVGAIVASATVAISLGAVLWLICRCKRTSAASLFDVRSEVADAISMPDVEEESPPDYTSAVPDFAQTPIAEISRIDLIPSDRQGSIIHY